MKTVGLSIVDRAIEFAAKLHRDQNRKGSSTPYITHPYAAGMILARAGYSEELIAAAILHDTTEDTNVTLEDIRTEFGGRVADIVEGCSEPDKKLSWEKRKQHTLDYLRTAPIDVRLVAGADKLHNISTIAEDYRVHGDAIWERFNRGKDQQARYYRGLVESLFHGLDESSLPEFFHQFKKEVEGVFGAERRH